MLQWRIQKNMTVITLMTSIDRSQKQEEKRYSCADVGRKVKYYTAQIEKENSYVTNKGKDDL